RQVAGQVDCARKNRELRGLPFVRSRSLLQTPPGFTDSFKNNYFRYPALPPAMLWKDSVPPLPPTNPRLQQVSGGTQISWDPPGPASDGEEARGYVIYRFRQGEALDIDDPRHILNIQFGSTSFIDDTALDSQDYVYVVTAIDRLNNESPASCRISTQLAGLP